MNAPFKHSSKQYSISVSKSGKLHLPTELRDKLRLENGGKIIAVLEDNEIRLMTIRANLEALRDLVAPLMAGDSVDQFLADRKAEAQREWDEGN